MKSSDAQPKIEGSSDKDSSDEESQDASSNLRGEAQKNDGTNLLDQGSHQEKEKRNNEAALTEERKKRLKCRLEEAISLIQTYRKTLDDEQKTCSFLFFYKSRNHAKFNYCKSLEDKLLLEIQKIDEIKKIDDLCSVHDIIHDIINEAHDSVIKTTNNAAKMEITKGVVTLVQVACSVYSDYWISMTHGRKDTPNSLEMIFMGLKRPVLLVRKPKRP